MTVRNVEEMVETASQEGGLSGANINKCHSELLELVRRKYPDCRVDLCDHQGACSFTFLVEKVVAAGDGNEYDTKRVIAQLREESFKLDLQILKVARKVYGAVVPYTAYKDAAEVRLEGTGSTVMMQIMEMEAIEGSRLDCALAKRHCREILDCKWINLIESFADVFVSAWKGGRKEDMKGLKHCHGRIGSSIVSRLERLESELPSDVLRILAGRTRFAVQQADIFDSLPVTVQHGDLLPSNLIVDLETLRIRGLLDWAEAEWLPFGINLYGLEHLLGRVIHVERDEKNHKVTFEYLAQAEALRHHFWSYLVSQIDELTLRPELMEAIHWSRTTGVLLWYGFAWDQGQIDRVVNWREDERELVQLEAFLAVGELSHPLNSTSRL